jgi:hypothetical protein
MMAGVIALFLIGFSVANGFAANSGNAGGPVAMRRLTQSQYRQIVGDIFGPSVKLGGRFEPDLRDAGLLAVGASQVSVTSSGFEQYDQMGRGIADQVVNPSHRALFITCRPASPTEPDDVCARDFLSKAGRLLYRRPLVPEEIDTFVAGARAATTKVHGFYDGIGYALAGLLEAPQFLFRQEVVEADPEHAGQYRLDAYSKASRLSFFLWNTAPDQELLAAAGNGDLDSTSGFARQVDRMMASPRLEAGVRAFFTDMLGFDSFDTLSKDTMLFPKYTPKLLADAQEQTLKTIVAELLVKKGDYRDLFTTRDTFLTPLLASIYRVNVMFPDGVRDTWLPYEYPADAQQAGILTQAGFVALHSQPGRSSATIRGKALREILLCQKVPDPPGNVNFNLVQDTSNPDFKTARQRLTAHRSQATCAGCHKIMDPIGLAMENFDTIGGFRTTENGAEIDASGELDGAKYTDVVGLGRSVHDNPAASSCLVNRLYAYAAGHKPTKSEGGWIATTLQKDFAAGGYKLTTLMRDVATSDVFYQAEPPRLGLLDTSSPAPMPPHAQETQK